MLVWGSVRVIGVYIGLARDRIITFDTSPGLKFRCICLLACCGGRGIQESAFSLVWLAEELISWNKFAILELFRTEDLVEESTGAGGFQQELCRDAVVRRTFVLLQYEEGNY